MPRCSIQLGMHAWSTTWDSVHCAFNISAGNAPSRPGLKTPQESCQKMGHPSLWGISVCISNVHPGLHVTATKGSSCFSGRMALARSFGRVVLPTCVANEGVSKRQFTLDQPRVYYAIFQVVIHLPYILTEVLTSSSFHPVYIVRSGTPCLVSGQLMSTITPKAATWGGEAAVPQTRSRVGVKASPCIMHGAWAFYVGVKVP